MGVLRAILRNVGEKVSEADICSDLDVYRSVHPEFDTYVNRMTYSFKVLIIMYSFQMIAIMVMFVDYCKKRNSDAPVQQLTWQLAI